MLTTRSCDSKSDRRGARTIIEVLREDPQAARISLDHGFHGPAQEISRERLLCTAQALAGHLQRSGVQPGDRVVTLLPTGEAFLRVMIATWLCKAAIVPAAPPLPGSRDGVARSRALGVLGVSRPKVIVGTEEALRWVPTELAAGILLMTTREAMENRPEGQWLDPPGGDDLALVQFTSGSTESPRGVLVRHDQLVWNLDAMARRVKISSEDRVVSWLPIYHDMGLIGGVCYPLQQKLPLLLVPTERFGVDPSVWLHSISRFAGTLSPAPNFAFELLSRRVPESRLKGLDLSSWRYSNVGAEPIFHGVLESFQKRFESYGLRPQVLHPSYGLAEATLGVSMAGPEESFRCEWVEAGALRHAQAAIPAIPNSPGAVAVVSNGTPLDGIEVRFVDERGENVPERCEGRVLIRGPYVTDGYLGEAPRSENSWLDTGDLGFQVGREIFITGRAKDLIIRGGANIHPQDVERAVSRVEGVRKGCVVAFSSVSHELERELTIVLAETKAQSAALQAELVDKIQTVSASELGLQLDRVILTAPRSLPKTSSGKLQRTRAREMLDEGQLPVCEAPEQITLFRRLRLWWMLTKAKLLSFGSGVGG